MSKPKNSKKPWPSSDVSLLKRLAKKDTAAEIADKLGRTEDAVQSKAQREGIKLKK
jgi:hypothetical protein